MKTIELNKHYLFALGTHHARAEAVYQQVKQKFGADHCHLLHINSQQAKPPQHHGGTESVKHAPDLSAFPKTTMARLQKLKGYIDGRENFSDYNPWLVYAIQKQSGSEVGV